MTLFDPHMIAAFDRLLLPPGNRFNQSREQ
jgi:hypothetical protein